jgi:NRAMP (natural resistance-associated macrophage protein)-like metal ion transporter
MTASETPASDRLDEQAPGSGPGEPRASFGTRLRTFLSVVGPGIITANVDNDAGGLTTYSQAGAHFGLGLLWIFIPVSLLLILVQEMVNRMGVVTGQGLSDMIRERFGVKVTFYLMLLVLATNFGNVMAEFAGIASAGQIFGLPPLLTVPVCGFLVWLLILKGSYKSVEKIFLFACLFYFAYPITLAIIRPDLATLGRALVTPHFELKSDFVVMLIGVIGTTIAPWMQFYQQASVAEKNISIHDYFYSKVDTVVGGVVVNVVAMSIVAVCAATLFVAHIQIDEAADAARALAPLAGRGSSTLYAAGLFNASVFAASILPLSTAYTICEALGWESGVDTDFQEAPQFYVLYSSLILLGSLGVLVPGLSPIKVMFWSQVINGLLLPVVLIFILLLVNDRRIMGSYSNGRFYNAVCWASVAALVVISLGYVVLQLFLA